jgi:hypothetical protein
MKEPPEPKMFYISEEVLFVNPNHRGQVLTFDVFGET